MDKERLEEALVRGLPEKGTRPGRLHEAMAYSLRPPAKRLRPQLVVAAWELAPGGVDPYPAAVAVEYAHTYSLMHDDLPCMDDSPLRRSKPSCHTQFDEATALLAGNALLTQAFRVLAQAYDAQRCQKLVACLSTALSSEGLMGGQMQDMLAQAGGTPSETVLEFIHRNKTAVLLIASLHMGAITSEDSSPERMQTLQRLGLNLGLAFQFTDDLLDATRSEDFLGKPSAQDQNKLTAVALYGIEGTRQRAQTYLTAAQKEAQSLPRNTTLVSIIQALEARNSVSC